MLTVHEALARVLAEVPAPRVERLPLADAWGRVLAADLTVRVDVPGWDNSAMDGYAVRAADTADGEVTLRLLETIAAGAVPTRAITAGAASAIMTGAPVPEGADAVVMVEHSDGAREGEVRLRGRAEPGQHIRRRGEDLVAGAPLLAAGATLSAAALGLASSQGLTTLPVARRPVVAILSTGDEVVAPGTPLGPGQLWSSNNATLAGLAWEAGATPLDLGILPDDLDAIVAGLDGAIRQADCVVTTGGVSVGAFDHVKAALDRLGVATGFWKVRMKPGKPLAYGVADRDGARVPVFGLPGNPVSCMVNFLQFVRPWLRASLGASDRFLPVVVARAGEDLFVSPGRLNLIRVRLARDGATWVARRTGSQSSGVLSSMLLADGLAFVEAPGVAAGGEVTVQLIAPLGGAAPGWP